MQGRVTKVLNMKPKEILLMVEEAAGVRMYEAKRRLALQTIEKKDVKIAQMNKVRSLFELFDVQRICFAIADDERGNLAASSKDARRTRSVQ